MAQNKISDLYKEADNTSIIPLPNESPKYHASQEMMVRICESLQFDANSDEYEEQITKTLDLLTKYFSEPKYFDRLLYSEISTFIFSLDDISMDEFKNSALLLLSYKDLSAYGSKVENAAIKIYDHCELAGRQKSQFEGNIYKQIDELQNDLISKQNQLSKDLDDAKKVQDERLSKAQTDFENTIKDTLRDHITIFGVFSAIIITFVGGISYSSSVLESMNIVSIFRLVFTICLLGLVLFNVIYFLFYVILKISNLSIQKEFSFFHAKTTILQFVNAMLLLIMFVDCLFYYIHAEKIRDYLDFLPWNK